MKLPDHPLAALFPLLPDNELQLLAADIKTNGQETPIVMHEGKILDGRNRYRACKLAKVEPKTKEYNGSDPLAFVLSHNLHRRHLSESQRAMIAAQIATRGPGKSNSANLPNTPTQETAAAAVGVSTRSVTTAAKVLDSGDTDLINQVKSGEKSVSAAAKSLPAKPAPKTKTKPPAGNAKYDAALERIGKVCGKKVKEAIEKNVLKISPKDVIFWAGLKDAGMADIQELVVAHRWAPKKAHASVNKMVTDKTRVEELIGLSMANQGEWEGTVSGYTITVKATKRR